MDKPSGFVSVQRTWLLHGVETLLVEGSRSKSDIVLQGHCVELRGEESQCIHFTARFKLVFNPWAGGGNVHVLARGTLPGRKHVYTFRNLWLTTKSKPRELNGLHKKIKTGWCGQLRPKTICHSDLLIPPSVFSYWRTWKFNREYGINSFFVFAFQVLPFEACVLLISSFTFEVSISVFDFTNFNFRLERSYFGWCIFQFSISNGVFLF